MFKEIAPFEMVGGTSILTKEAVSLYYFKQKKIEHGLLKAAEGTERFRKSGSGHLGLRILTAARV
ncbi:MAG TPA: hypothetical protein VGI33_15320 [Paenibacillus sp.]|jgi:hypothetical protein